MYIQPNSTIELFRDLRLDNNYSNTMWFSSVASQNTFFENKKVYTLNNQMYQRKNAGIFRCSLPIGTCFDLNYMRYKNTATGFENKWFYAFVDKIVYINNGRCDIYFTIDVIQTYMFDWTLHECMIERQHSTTDVAGDNLQPEGLELGTMVNHGAPSLGECYGENTDMCAVLMVSFGTDDSSIEQYISDLAESTGGSAGTGTISGLPSTVSWFKFYSNTGVDPNNTWSRLRSAIIYLQTNNKIENIVNIFLIPKAFVNLNSSTAFSQNITTTKETSFQKELDEANDYTPTNKKLLTYPYCLLKVYSPDGNNYDFHYERFKLQSGYIQFAIKCVLSCRPEALLVPIGYDMGGTDLPNFEKTITCGDFANIPYASDGYKSWLALNYGQVLLNLDYAQQSYNIAQQNVDLNAKSINENAKYSKTMSMYGIGNSAFNAGVGAMGIAEGVSDQSMGYGLNNNPYKSAGKVGSNLIGISSGIVDIQHVDKVQDISMEENELKGQSAELEKNYKIASGNMSESVAKKLPNTVYTGNSSTMSALKRKGFVLQKMTIRKQFAERIDKYFTMFGYAQNKVATPNIHVRSRFTYIKTSNSVVSGSIPQDDRSLIDTIFDRGIRFWTDYNTFENYDLPNTII